MSAEASQLEAKGWLRDNGPKELELLFRAIVYHPAVPILIADNDRNYRDASAGAGKLLGLPRIRSSAAAWMTLRRLHRNPRFRSFGAPYWNRVSSRACSNW